MARPIPPLALTADEHDTLRGSARRPTTAEGLVELARVMLECVAGNRDTVAALGLR